MDDRVERKHHENQSESRAQAAQPAGGGRRAGKHRLQQWLAGRLKPDDSRAGLTRLQLDDEVRIKTGIL
ncbi:MAG: hypothetical protein RSH52_22325, partial [Janthinobacterium sp.]